MTKAKPSRRRDSAASRELLLRAASELFADRGYDRTTARDIGERAGVDPALIARYFGGKSQLYIAVLRSQEDSDTFTPLTDDERLSGLLERVVQRGPGPIFQAALRPSADSAAQTMAMAELNRRVIAPLSARLAERGEERPELRAELLTAVFIGVILGRHAGTLPHLAGTTKEELLSLLRTVIPMDGPDDPAEPHAPEPE
ncbi:TetR/AcrR family transcriptional regulator [Nonomuraea jiangxiensis]|uniref:DNA-binding transcriptional regulator, AcrR family n=1 Tax=Nonomuraea jiangxiensis TaxID=633440 RepID=A0A1G9J3X9_9ACTN|nr:TetR/AcrR family transcriptional regulator [Nonomuraea jiangxiensis]SDL32200.1 DNA-binding transcriptional regulator, AcrR family [Nonomuraea jiangxiensis]